MSIFLIKLIRLMGIDTKHIKIVFICVPVFSLLCGCSNSIPVSEDSFSLIQDTSNSVCAWNTPSADLNSTTAALKTESLSEQQNSEQEPLDEEESDEAALEARVEQLFEQAVRLKDMHKTKKSATFCEPTPDGEYLIYKFGEIDTYEKYEELLKDTYTEDLVNDYFQKAENGRMVNVNHQLAVPCDSIFTTITEESWEDAVPAKIERIEEGQCSFTCASYVWIETDYGAKKAYDEKYVTAVLCEDGKWRLDRTSIDFDYAVPAEEVNLFTEGSPMKAEIRRLCDQNILLMDMFIRKYGQTHCELSADGSYTIYEFGDIDTYSKYKALMCDTYVSKTVDFYLFQPASFYDIDDRLIIYVDKDGLVIDNVDWGDYQLEILWQSEKKCYFQCIAFEYIGGEYEADGSNKKVYEKHKAAAVLCDDGQWRLEYSFF